MAHFAQIKRDNSNNWIVTRVLVVSDKNALTEEVGINYLQGGLGGEWKQTSYNTQGGVHKLGGTPLRKNYAGKGYKYDSTRDAFIPSKPYQSWTLNEDTCLWEAPVAYPDDDKNYTWNEETTSWDEIA
jgi:hypothetical protein